MVLSPASTLTAMNGKPCQTRSSVSNVYAGSAAVVQLNPAELVLPTSQSGRLLSAQSTTPPSGENSQKKMTLADTTGVAQASSAAVLTKAAILRPSRFRSSPTSVPAVSVRNTTTAAKIKLMRSDSQNSGSLSTVA